MKQKILDDLAGQIFGRWTVLGRYRDEKRPRQTLWDCQCQCGNKKVVNAESLKAGLSTSCGCYRTELCKTKSGNLSPQWKGGTMTLPTGYIKVLDKNHPNANYNGYVFEHVYVMSKKLGRPLAKDERVHHKDCDKKNNHISNLELWNRGHPSGRRVTDLIEFAWKTIDRYDSQNPRLIPPAPTT